MSTLSGKKSAQLNNFLKGSKGKIKKILFNRAKKTYSRGLFKNPFFYFGSLSIILLVFLFLGSQSLAKLSYFNGDTVLVKNFLKDNKNIDNSDPFFSQDKAIAIETPDLKIQDNFIYGVSTPRILTAQTLGDVFGEAPQARKEVVDYSVQPGDTIESVAQHFNISANTVMWANNLSRGQRLKEGQSLTILPVSGVIHIVKQGDTVSQVAKNYKAKADDVIAFNDLANEADIFVGDILIVPDGVMPSKLAPSIIETPLAGSSWIFPLLKFKETQGLHFFNAVDLASLDGCGSSVYAVAEGTVQRAVGNGKWNFGMGNHVIILHPNGVTTYYGHLSTVFVKPGDKVDTGDRIGLEGQTGEATGCHVHFQVMGASNYVASRVRPGQIVDVTKK